MLNLLRVLCLVTTIVSVGVCVVWRRAPKFVRALDDEHVAAFEELHEDRLDAAAEMLKTDREQGLLLLEALLEDLEHVRKLDRLDEVKRKVLGLFVRQYEATDRQELALRYADLFDAFDERDLHNQARRNHLMLRDPARRERRRSRSGR